MAYEVVVTGASGFIGGALLNQLSKSNIPATGLSRQKVEGLTTVSSYLDWLSSKDAILIHLAQPRNATNPSDGDEIALCRSLCSKSWQHIIYVSSSIVYGDTRGYLRRPDEKVTAVNEYAMVKLECESIVASAGGTCLRFANVYGPGMAPNSVIADILGQIPGIGPLMVKDKIPICDFVWIEDAVRCVVLASIVRPGILLNVGSGTGISIGNLAELTLNLAGEETRPVVSKTNLGRSSHLVLDISQTQNILNWSPEWDISGGLSYLLKLKMSNE
ncbi:MAG: NAD(P)-dependent oxidoreductase [Bacteroidetes bacterium]|nr:NAD(P)-dependent oxidoreductase [Bacteroidota bacterium]